MSHREKVLLTALLALMGLAMFYQAVQTLDEQHQDCRAKGGEIIRAAGSNTICVRKDSIIQIK